MTRLLWLSFLLVTTAQALPAPKYLSVPHWRSCVDTETIDNDYTYYCVPSSRPRDCPVASWQQFQTQNLMKHCKVNF